MSLGYNRLKQTGKAVVRKKTNNQWFETQDTKSYWDSFLAVYQEDNHIIGKENTKGIKGSNCRLQHRIWRAFRKTCCFSKKLFNTPPEFLLVLSLAR